MLKKKILKLALQHLFLINPKFHWYPLVCRYLGTTISIKNSDLEKNVCKFCNLLLRIFFKCSVNVKCYLFKTYCSNLYCAQMWFDCTKTALTRLKVAYNNSLRRFMGLPYGTTVLVKCLLT